MSAKMEVTFEGNIAVLEMCGGQNQLNPEFFIEFNKALDTVLSNESAAALITTGQGKFYSTGIDLNRFISFNSAEIRGFWDAFNRTMLRLITFPMPTIAALNGHAFAGGAFIALAQDYRVMRTDRGWFTFNEVYMPARFPEFLVEVLRLKLPPGPVFTDVIAMGRRLGGQDAAKLGIVHTACEGDQLMTKARELAQDCLKNGEYPRSGMEDIKNDMYAILREKINAYEMIKLSKI